MNDIAAWVQGVGGRPSAGSEWVLSCPWCRKFRLYVNSEEGESWDNKPLPPGRWICFACGEKSLGLAKLMCEIDGIPFQDARNIINRWKFDGITFKAPKVIERVQREQWLPVEYEPIFDGVRWLWPKYLTTRRIERETAAQLKLGVVRRHDRCDHPRCCGNGCPNSLTDRIVLPIECPLGNDFQARAINPDVEPRYMSGKDAGQLLFGWATVAESDFALLVEGPFDAIRAIQAGIPTVALMGKTLRDGQRQMLTKRSRQYVILLDPPEKDPDAIDMACKIAWTLGGTVGVSLQTDPGDATEDAVIDAVHNAVAPREAADAARAIRLAQNALAMRR